MGEAVMKIGAQIHFLSPLQEGDGELVAIITAGALPTAEDLISWKIAEDFPLVRRKAAVDRYVFRRTNGYTVIVPEKLLREVVRETES